MKFEVAPRRLPTPVLGLHIGWWTEISFTESIHKLKGFQHKVLPPHRKTRSMTIATCYTCYFNLWPACMLLIVITIHFQVSVILKKYQSPTFSQWSGCQSNDKNSVNTLWFVFRYVQCVPWLWHSGLWFVQSVYWSIRFRIWYMEHLCHCSICNKGNRLFPNWAEYKKRH